MQNLKSSYRIAVGALLSGLLLSSSAAMASTYQMRVASPGLKSELPTFAILNAENSPLSNIVFPLTAQGATSSPVTVKLANTGKAPLVFGNIAVEVLPPFVQLSTTCSGTLPERGECAISMAYRPTSAEAVSGAYLVVSSNAGSMPVPTLSGSPDIAGEAVFTTVGAQSFTVPSNVTSISVVAVGGGGGGGVGSGVGGSGGGLTYRNDIAVVPGQLISVVVGGGGVYGGAHGGYSSVTVNGIAVTAAGGGTGNRVPGCGSGGVSFCGGAGGRQDTGYANFNPGGGGAAGYAGNGGSGGDARIDANTVAANGKNAAPNSGAGGGGAGTCSYSSSSGLGHGGGGGGVGLYGIGTDGVGGLAVCGSSNYVQKNAGSAGSGGEAGTGHNPGKFGGASSASTGAQGAVRIIWGAGRSFPHNAQ